MELQAIFFLVGRLITCLGLSMLIPAAADFVDDRLVWPFFVEACGITVLSGVLISLANHTSRLQRFTIRDVFLMTNLSWVALCSFAALPFILAGTFNSTVDALFEATSGLTTTGATVYVGLDLAPKGLLLWRALLQWIGGIGIVVTALAVMPTLSVGGMQLFQSEYSDRSDKILPRVSQVSIAILGVYMLFTVFCIWSLWLVGMPFFEAICHGLSTVATGGMSTSDQSIGHYDSFAIEAVVMVFMILGATPTIFYIHLLKRDAKSFRNRGEIKLLISFVVIFPAIIAAWKFYNAPEGLGVTEEIRAVLFNSVSVITTTGYSSADYSNWGFFSIFLLFGLGAIGACSGSASGGIKLFRLQIIFSLLKHHILKLRHPHAVSVPTYGGRDIAPDIFTSVLVFFALFLITFMLIAIGLAFVGLDAETCLSAAMASVTSLGPGLGDIVGPAGHYGSLPESSKILLMTGMLAGRLEFLTFLVMFIPVFWHD